MRRGLSAALRHDRSHWCPLYIIPGLAVLYGIRSAPICPAATALAVGALAWARRDTWGPPPLTETLQHSWLSATRWAHRGMPTWIPPRQQQAMQKAVDLINQADSTLFWDPRTALPRALLQALYLAM